jgi:hypothetical protein
MLFSIPFFLLFNPKEHNLSEWNKYESKEFRPGLRFTKKNPYGILKMLSLLRKNLTKLTKVIFVHEGWVEAHPGKRGTLPIFA